MLPQTQWATRPVVFSSPALVTTQSDPTIFHLLPLEIKLNQIKLSSIRSSLELWKKSFLIHSVCFRGRRFISSVGFVALVYSTLQPHPQIHVPHILVWFAPFLWVSALRLQLIFFPLFLSFFMNLRSEMMMRWRKICHLSDSLSLSSIRAHFHWLIMSDYRRPLGGVAPPIDWTTFGVSVSVITPYHPAHPHSSFSCTRDKNLKSSNIQTFFSLFLNLY